MARIHPLDPLFRPRSIAILGATPDFVKINGRPLRFLLDKGYPGRIFPVNPKYERVADLACYPAVSAIPEPVDLAIIAVPASAALDAVRQCAAKGVRAAVIFSSGFAELGEEGRALQQRIAEVANRGGLRVCGPNTLGFMNTFDRVPATFSQAGEGEVSAGPTAFVTQSGAFGTAIFALARQRGLSFGYFVNSGNEADLEFADLLEYVVTDPQVAVASGYIEGLKDGRKLWAVADRALELGKPIVIVKVGRSSAGTRAALSHTGSLAGSDRVYDGIFRQLGIIRAVHEEELLDLVSAFSVCPLPRGRGLAIVTQSGGAGVLMADRAEEVGLAVPELASTTQAALRNVIPPFGAVKNPVDITAQFIAEPALLRASLEIVLDDPQVDVGVFYLGLMERFADDIVASLKHVHAHAGKPLIVAWAAAPDAGLSALRASGICVLPTATRAVNAVRGLVEYATRRAGWMRERRQDDAEPRSTREIRRAENAGGGAQTRRTLATREAFGLLARSGIRVARSRISRTADEAVRAAEAIGYPVALKVDSPAIPHKTEAGVVRLNLAGADAVAQAFEEIARRAAPAEIHGIVVQEMVQEGIEVIIGLHRDPQFGPLVMVGLGGIFVEVLEDVAFRAAPLTRADVREMLGELRGARILDGFRGRPAADIEGLTDVLLAVSRLAVDGAPEEVVDLDINPLIVLPVGHGAVAVDALVAVKEAEDPDAPV